MREQWQMPAWSSPFVPCTQLSSHSSLPHYELMPILKNSKDGHCSVTSGLYLDMMTLKDMKENVSISFSRFLPC
jgi:hypothetical protein